MTPIATIQRVVAEHFLIGERDMKGRSRYAHIVRPRHVAMHLAREVGHRPAEIAAAFNRERTTTYKAIERVRERMRRYPIWARTIEELKRKIEEAGRG